MWPEFMGTIQAQSDSNFTLLVITDSVDVDLPPRKNPITKVAAEGTPAALRKRLLAECGRLNAEGVVLLDSDDLMAADRMAKSRSALETGNGLVVNELNFFSGPFSASNSKPWLSTILKDNFINLKTITESNCIGFSNIAFRMDRLPKTVLDIGEDVIAFDWAFATRFLLAEESASFLRDTTTYYRQHADSLAVIATDEATIARALEVKQRHYQDLLKVWPSAKTYLEKVESLLRMKEAQSAKWPQYVQAVQTAKLSGLWWSQAPL
jgi:hypothetical protein